MHALDDWAAHPQGRAVAAEPLIAWRQTADGGSSVEIERLKVLDLTRVLAGPVATRFLAGFGAEVLRIDPPWWNEPGVEPEVTVGKRRAELNLTRTEDRRVFERLLADIVNLQTDASLVFGFPNRHQACRVRWGQRHCTVHWAI